jgi:hypothetical protein
MSKPNENDPLKNNSNDPNLGGNNKPSNNKGLSTIEEHAKNNNIDAPVFAAVMESQKWASGKRVPAAIFEKAVKNFLGASMGDNTPKGGV